MRRCSLKVAPRHDRMYIIGLLACADHFTTSSAQSQTHTSRRTRFFRAGVWKRERAPESRKTGHNAKAVPKRTGGSFPTFSSDPEHPRDPSSQRPRSFSPSTLAERAQP